MGKGKVAGIIKKLQKDKNLEGLGITTLGDDDSPCVVHDWVSTGCLALDRILGGGLPIGRLTEMYGEPSAGKSLIAAQVAAIAQLNDYIVCYADTETAVSRPIMEDIGVDVDNLIYSSPDTVEEVFTLFESTIELKDPEDTLIIIWDSIAATSNQAEMENEYGKATMGSHARLISQGLRKLTRIMAKERVAGLFLNQTRQKIGVMFGDKDTTFGGNAVPFHSSVRVKLDVGSKIKVGKDKIIGVELEAYVTKNKIAMPFQRCKLPVYFGHGIDDAEASFLWLKTNEYITSAGSYHTIDFGDKELKFQRKDWGSIYNKYYDTFADIILKE